MMEGGRKKGGRKIFQKRIFEKFDGWKEVERKGRYLKNLQR